jgi:CubicO group peptidase (beta-lactamase class C family)
MSVLQGATDFFLIERIFNQLSSTVAIALLKKDVLCYEFYGGKKLNGKIGAQNPINRNTRFNIGTATMFMTGALIVKLMEFGELRLNDKVKRFKPAFKFDGITIYHLLTHTSGLDFNNLSQPDNYMAKKEFFSQLYKAETLSYPTGSRYALFPYGYAILADIAERVTGQSIEELAATLIFMPLGMSHTTYSNVTLTDDQYVFPWSHKENRFLSEFRENISTGFSGLYTTVMDLLRFGRIFLNAGEYSGRQIFLESSIDFMMRDITSGRFMRTPIFMINGNGAAHDCFSKYHSDGTIAQIGDTGSILFIDPLSKTVGAALTNSTWVHDASHNYSNICDILMGI